MMQQSLLKILWLPYQFLLPFYSIPFIYVIFLLQGQRNLYDFFWIWSSSMIISCNSNKTSGSYLAAHSNLNLSPLSPIQMLLIKFLIINLAILKINSYTYQFAAKNGDSLRTPLEKIYLKTCSLKLNPN